MRIIFLCVELVMLAALLQMVDLLRETVRLLNQLQRAFAG